MHSRQNIYLNVACLLKSLLEMPFLFSYAVSILSMEFFFSAVQLCIHSRIEKVLLLPRFCCCWLGRREITITIFSLSNAHFMYLILYRFEIIRRMLLCILHVHFVSRLLWMNSFLLFTWIIWFFFLIFRFFFPLILIWAIFFKERKFFRERNLRLNFKKITALKNLIVKFLAPAVITLSSQKIQIYIENPKIKSRAVQHVMFGDFLW